MQDLSPDLYPVMLKILLAVITLMLSFISALLLVIVWFLKEYARRIDNIINDHHARIIQLEKNHLPNRPLLSGT